MEQPTCTPPPDGPTPAGVDIDELRRKARDLANDAANRDDSVEWGGLIWADANGDLHITELATDNRSDRAAFDLRDIPPGGRIVGTYHSHPHLQGENVNQGLLNSEDRLIVDALRAHIAENDLGIIIDPNAMMYVTDNERGVTKEFDVSDPRNAYGTVLGPCGSR